MTVMWSGYLTENNINVESATFEQMKDAVNGVFTTLYPVHMIQWDLCNVHQREDEPFSQYYARVQNLCLEADYDKMSKEDMLCIGVILRNMNAKDVTAARRCRPLLPTVSVEPILERMRLSW